MTDPRGYEAIKALTSTKGVYLRDVLALSEDNDPFYAEGSPAEVTRRSMVPPDLAALRLWPWNPPAKNSLPARGRSQRPDARRRDGLHQHRLMLEETPDRKQSGAVSGVGRG